MIYLCSQSFIFCTVFSLFGLFYVLRVKKRDIKYFSIRFVIHQFPNCELLYSSFSFWPRFCSQNVKIENAQYISIRFVIHQFPKCYFSYCLFSFCPLPFIKYMNLYKCCSFNYFNHINYPKISFTRTTK